MNEKKTQEDLFDYLDDNANLFVPMNEYSIDGEKGYFINIEVSSVDGSKKLISFLDREDVEKYIIKKGPTFKYSTVTYSTIIKKLNKVYGHSKVKMSCELATYSTSNSLVEVGTLWNAFAS